MRDLDFIEFPALNGSQIAICVQAIEAICSAESDQSVTEIYTLSGGVPFLVRLPFEGVMRIIVPTWTETKEPTLNSRLFGGREMPLTSVLFALAAQEGNDGDTGDAMQAAGEFIRRLMRNARSAP